jgi:copper chaperone NosL
MKIFLLTLTFFSILSCTIVPEAISYGKDNCQFCKMTIMDPKFGCEIVSKKGKIFKFDDLSCMIKYMKVAEQNYTEFAHVLVNQYDKPNNFIAISDAYFINSQKYQSPMMGYTAAFSDEKQAFAIVKIDNEAKKFTWNELVKKF